MSTKRITECGQDSRSACSAWQCPSSSRLWPCLQLHPPCLRRRPYPSQLKHQLPCYSPPSGIMHYYAEVWGLGLELKVIGLLAARACKRACSESCGAGLFQLGLCQAWSTSTRTPTLQYRLFAANCTLVTKKRLVRVFGSRTRSVWRAVLSRRRHPESCMRTCTGKDVYKPVRGQPNICGKAED